MKKSFLIPVFFVFVLSLFSFRSVEKPLGVPNVINSENFSVEYANFVQDYKTFPDNFTAWRREWSEYKSLGEMSISMEEMASTLEKY